MKILYTAFKGLNNSSKILLDKIKVDMNDKLYLTNSLKTSEKELKRKLINSDYDLIISFGQLKLPKDTIRLEYNGIDEIGTIYSTNYDYTSLINKLKENNFTVIKSFKTNYLCNNIFYNGLKLINLNNLKCQMIFIHISKIKNIEKLDILANLFQNM